MNQLRHDVDDVYELLDATHKSVRGVVVKQLQHDNRLHEILVAQDLTVGRLDRLEQGQSEHSAKIDSLDSKMDRVLTLLTDNQSGD